jgi:hypothetical protein
MLARDLRSGRLIVVRTDARATGECWKHRHDALAPPPTPAWTPIRAHTAGDAAIRRFHPALMCRASRRQHRAGLVRFWRMERLLARNTTRTITTPARALAEEKE